MEAPHVPLLPTGHVTFPLQCRPPRGTCPEMPKGMGKQLGEGVRLWANLEFLLRFVS